MLEVWVTLGGHMTPRDPPDVRPWLRLVHFVKLETPDSRNSIFLNRFHFQNPKFFRKQKESRADEKLSAPRLLRNPSKSRLLASRLASTSLVTSASDSTTQRCSAPWKFLILGGRKFRRRWRQKLLITAKHLYTLVTKYWLPWYIEEI